MQPKGRGRGIQIGVGHPVAGACKTSTRQVSKGLTNPERAALLISPNGKVYNRRDMQALFSPERVERMIVGFD
jgi:hypothetical protein